MRDFIRGLLFTAFTGSCFSTSAATRLCTNAAQPGVQFSKRSVLTQLPSEIRDRMILAIDQTLAIGDNDSGRGQTLTDWSARAISGYRMMGLEENDIKEKVNRRLTSYFHDGLSAGLSPDLNLLEVLRQRVPFQEAGDFAGKYALTKYKVIASQIGRVDLFAVGHSYYNAGSLAVAFSMACSVSDEAGASMALVHMLQVRDYESAFKAAEKMQDGQMLINIGLIALSDFFDPTNKSPGKTNSLGYGIESLKRVQGDLKNLSDRLLYDLALELTSEGFLALSAAELHLSARSRQELLDAAFDSIAPYSLRALRSTGQVIDRTPIDSSKVDFRNHVSDEGIRGEIQRQVDRYMMASGRVDFQEVLEALAAIDDKGRLNSYAEVVYKQKLRHPQSGLYLMAFDFYRAAGNLNQAKNVLHVLLEEGIQGLTRLDYEIRLPERMRLIGDREGLLTLQKVVKEKLAISDQDQFDNSSWKIAQGFVERALAGVPLTPSSEVVAEDMDLSKDLRDQLALEAATLENERHAREKLNVKNDRDELRAASYKELAEGEDWAAYQGFEKALDRAGLLATADQMLAHKNGLNATRVLVSAALLLPEDQSRSFP